MTGDGTKGRLADRHFTCSTELEGRSKDAARLGATRLTGA